MKYVITGGAGFIGSYIVKLLVKKGHTVIIIDNLHTGSLSRLKEVKDKIIFHNIDIRNYEKLKNIIKDVDGIFHQAALTIVPESFLKPDEYFDVNVNGTKNIFIIAKKLGIKVVFASSSSIYGDVKKVPIKENFEKNPINPYGKTKVEKEKLAEKFWNEGVNIIGLRYFNVYGIGQTGTYAGVITQFMKKIDNNLPPIIHGKGNQIRDFIAVEDVAKANLMSMESSTNQNFVNIGTGKSISILELAKMMIKISSKNLSPSFDDELPGDIEKSQADITMSKEKIEWMYNIELIDGLKKLMSK
ncbi:MAG: NAD-dependent epimerase [Thaumarchaeota archaeon]|jgi:UDP-glucose 4-epimerase|nr:MAG: NAD-dependent epimerase [Nitrososphaerota archaeon]